MYLTLIKQKEHFNQVSLFGNTIIKDAYNKFINIETTIDKLSEKMKQKALQLEEIFINFINSIRFNITETMQEHYSSFKIPKKSGGFREINAPSEELKDIQKKIVEFFQNYLKIWPSNNCFAYTQNRNHIEAVKIHQKNNSKYFLKLDIKDFFPSCTIEELTNKLINIYPISYWKQSTIENQFTKISLND